jgi:hypothetical protein
MNATDAMYSRRINGAWTPPQKVADLPGPDSGTVLAVGPARRCVTAWMNTGDAGADICAAIWDGAAWTPPAKLSSVSRCKDPAAGFVGDRPVVVWVQGRDGDPQTEDDLYLYQSIYDGQWSAPVLIAELAALANLDGGSAAGAQASVSTPKLASTLYQTSAPAIASAAIQLTGAGSGLFPPPEGCCGEEPQPPTPPTPPTDPGDNTSTTVVRPRDPNDKLGPAGVGPDHVVSTKDEIEYIIRFENATNATAPVQELVVVDYLDKNLDWTTLRFGNITYGDRVVTLPADALQYSLRDLPPTNSTAITGTTAGQMAVDLSVSFNPQTGRIEWRAKAIDTGLTNLPPADPLAGILPPENGTGRGNGHVTFSVKPRTDAPLGTVITNRASIVFDTEDPMDTPPVWNTLGDVEPHRGVAMAYLPSRVADLLANTSSVSRRVSRQTTSIASQLQANQGAWAAAFSAGGASAAAANQADNAKQGSGESESSSVVAAVDSGSTPGSSGQPPALLIRRLSNEVELSWPAALPDRHLEVAADLTASANWQPANKAPAMINGRFVVRVEYTNSARFYRLRK